MSKEGGGFFLLWSDVLSAIRGVVRYCDSLHYLVLPVGSGTGCLLSSNCNALGLNPTLQRIFLEI